MRNRRHPARLVLASAAVSAVTVLPLLVAAVPAGAVTPAEQSVTVFLSPPDRAGLQRLAADRHLDRRARAARYRALLPGAAQRRAVADRLTAAGLHVRSVRSTSVTVSGPAARIRALFGSARAHRPQSPVAQSLPRVPAALAGLVTTAFGGDETRPAFRHHDFDTGYSGPEVRAAYDAANTGPYSSTAPIIATLQLSGWDSRALQAYNGGTALPTGQYTGVPVDRVESWDSSRDGSGDVEVALDQEALLGVAPNARQRAYFASNSDQGFIAGVQQVADDASAGLPIWALSISWGSCEAANDPSFFDRLEDALTNARVAGVTVFAATGDNGVEDCTDYNGTPVPSRAVDYPAASPQVVAVGGTTLDNRGSTPVETGWSGSGGGTSTHFARPAYQQRMTGLGTGRLVPDIAVEADQTPGLRIVMGPVGSYPAGTSMAVGGTSLASPISAALLVDHLQAHGATAGIGDIHDLLYGGTVAFRDVSSGSNGSPATPGYTASCGYDQVTGLGAPLWEDAAPASRIAAAAACAGLADVDASGPEQARSSGSYRPYTAGAVYDSPTTGAHAVTGQMSTRYLALGDVSGVLGWPVTDPIRVRGGWEQWFQGGRMYQAGSTVAVLRGALLTRYLQLGGPAGPLGLPLGDDQPVGDGVGRYVDFTSGSSLYSSPASGIRQVGGAIRTEWRRTGGVTGPLGYPVTDETRTPDGIGRFNHFSKAGSVYWTAATGAHEVHGQIRAVWARTGWERGPLGYPTTSETGSSDRVGRFNHFSKGASVFWSPSSGAHEVHGAIRSAWAATGWERGRLGYPVSDEYAVPGGRANTFQHGSIRYDFAVRRTTASYR